MKFYPYSYNGVLINNGTPNYTSRFSKFGLTPARPIYTKRSGGTQYAAYAGKELGGGQWQMNIFCHGTLTAQDSTLKALFDTADTSTHVLVVTPNADGTGTQWYVDAAVIGFDPIDGANIRVTFALRDPVMKTVATTTESTWAVTASGQTDVTTINQGNLEAYPIYEITPTGSKSGNSYKYRRFIEIINNKSWAFNNYPIELLGSLNTSTLVAASKMLASGFDSRIFVDDAEEEDRWLDGWNGATSKAWININLAAKQTFTLKTAIGTAGAIASVDVNEDISRMPDTGIIKIDSERLTYTAKNIAAKTFTGITRGAHESTAATHLAAAAVTWIEHSIYFYHGDLDATAGPATDNTRKPMFNLNTSTNTSWDYDEFWSNDPRSAEWQPVPSPLAAVTHVYTGNQYTEAEPAIEVGMLGGRIDALGAAAPTSWILTHPAGITNWNFANGQKYNLILGESYLYYNTAVTPLAYSTTWTGIYAIPATTVANTWQAWSDSRALGATYYHIAIQVKTKNAARVECADITLTLDSANVPTRTLGSEVTSVYDLNAVLKNDTTGESITIRTQLEQNQTLRIDTLNKTVTYLKDNSNRFPAMLLTGSNFVRAQWLRLIQGANTLSYTDANTGNVSVVIKWQGRNN